PRAGKFTHRLDSVPPGGGVPGSDPDFAREQLLEEYDMSAPFLTVLNPGVGGNEPNALAVALAAACHDHIPDAWLTADSRWRGSICIPIEDAAASAREIAKRAEESPAWSQIMLSSRTDYPFGNPRYWPIMEAAVEYDLPLAFHVGNNRL